MPRLHVVYDTNVYRKLSRDHFAQLRAAERQHSVVGVGARWVAMELANRLTRDDDPRSVGSAWHALRRMVEHCRWYNGWTCEIPMLGGVDEQFAALLFGRYRREEEATYAAFAAVIGRIARAPSADDCRQERDALEPVAEAIAGAEAHFIEQVREHVLRHTLPTAESWSAIARDPVLRAQALADLEAPDTLRSVIEPFVRRAAEWAHAGHRSRDGRPSPPSDYEIERRVVEMSDVMRGPARFVTALFEPLVRDGAAPDPNTTWDLLIGLTAAVFARFDRTGLWLITDDGPVLRAAEASGTDDVIRSLADYEVALAQRELRPPPTAR